MFSRSCYSVVVVGTSVIGFLNGCFPFFLFGLHVFIIFFFSVLCKESEGGYICRCCVCFLFARTFHCGQHCLHNKFSLILCPFVPTKSHRYVEPSHDRSLQRECLSRKTVIVYPPKSAYTKRTVNEYNPWVVFLLLLMEQGSEKNDTSAYKILFTIVN